VFISYRILINMLFFNVMQAWNLYFRQSRVYAKIDTHSAALLPEERNNRET